MTLAAAGLLILKVAALLADGAAPADPALPDFARSIAKARTGYEVPDPTTTGSVTPSEPKRDVHAEAKPPEVATAVASANPPATGEPVSASERALLEKLAARRDALRQRTEALDLREQMLGAAEKRLEAGTADLRQAEERAEAASVKRVEAEKAGMKAIVTMYESMKPKDAARVFDRLALDVLVPIVTAANPRKMAEILAVMTPETAEKLTVALANRAQGVGGPVQSASAGLPAGELPALDGDAGRP